MYILYTYTWGAIEDVHVFYCYKYFLYYFTHLTLHREMSLVVYTTLTPVPDACPMKKFFSGDSMLTACKPIDRRPTSGPLSTE